MVKAVTVSSSDSPHAPDVYLDAGPHPHQTISQLVDCSLT